MLDYETVKEKFPEVRTAYGASGLEYYVHCPQFHKKGGQFKLSINAESGLGLCHDCGFALNAEEEWFATDPFSWVNPLKFNRDEGKLKPVTGNFMKYGGPVIENNIPSPGKLVTMKSLPFDHPAWMYLSDRGFDVDEISRFEGPRELKYCSGPFEGRNRGMEKIWGRIIFPVYSEGILKGWQARRVERTTEMPGGATYREVWNGEAWIHAPLLPSGRYPDHSIPKYLNSPNFQKTQVVYGLDWAKQTGIKEVIIVEGPLDQIRVGPTCVCTFGLVSHQQKNFIESNFESAVLILDPEIRPDNPDPKVRSKYETTLGMWDPNFKLTPLWLPHGKDPGGTERYVIFKEIEKAKLGRSLERETAYQQNKPYQ